MVVAKHVHRLKKHKYKTGIAVFFCTLPDCSYKVEVPFALGKESLCNICGNPFILTERELKTNRPHCQNCGKMAVKDADGKKRFINKGGPEVLSAMADDNIKSLRERLDAAIAILKDEDV